MAGDGSYGNKLENEQLVANLMEIHQKYHGYIKEKQSDYVPQGAILGCTYGSLYTRLDAKIATNVTRVIILPVGKILH